jgi:hypothetical protein
MGTWNRDRFSPCQRVVETGRSGGRCLRERTCVGSLRAERQTYLIEACEQHMSGLIDAAPLGDEGNDARSQTDVTQASIVHGQPPLANLRPAPQIATSAIERLGQECLASNALANTISSLFTTVSSDEAVE